MNDPRVNYGETASAQIQRQQIEVAQEQLDRIIANVNEATSRVYSHMTRLVGEKVDISPAKNPEPPVPSSVMGKLHALEEAVSKLHQAIDRGH